VSLEARLDDADQARVLEFCQRAAGCAGGLTDNRFDAVEPHGALPCLRVTLFRDGDQCPTLVLWHKPNRARLDSVEHLPDQLPAHIAAH
jgi:hypothetical protein